MLLKYTGRQAQTFEGGITVTGEGSVVQVTDDELARKLLAHSGVFVLASEEEKGDGDAAEKTPSEE